MVCWKITGKNIYVVDFPSYEPPFIGMLMDFQFPCLIVEYAGYAATPENN
jgi:hypothetical protein